MNRRRALCRHSSRSTYSFRGRSVFPGFRALWFEPLEGRLLLNGDIVAHWIGGSGDWWEPSNWDIGTVPNNSGDTNYSAVIDLPASDPVITIGQSVTINALTNAESVRVIDGSTTVSNQADNSGFLEVAGASASAVFGGNVTNTGDACCGRRTMRPVSFSSPGM